MNLNESSLMNLLCFFYIYSMGNRFYFVILGSQDSLILSSHIIPKIKNCAKRHIRPLYVN